MPQLLNQNTAQYIGFLPLQSIFSLLWDRPLPPLAWIKASNCSPGFYLRPLQSILPTATSDLSKMQI